MVDTEAVDKMEPEKTEIQEVGLVPEHTGGVREDKQEMELEETFAFDIYHEGYRKKQRESMLADPYDYVKEIVRSAVQNDASKINFKCSKGKVEAVFDTGYAKDDFLARAKRKEDPMHRALVAGNNIDNVTRVQIETISDGVATVASLDEKMDLTIEEKATKKSDVTMITVHKKSKWLGAKKGSEEERLQEECAFAPLEITVNGKNISKELGLEDVICQVDIDRDGVTGKIGIPALRFTDGTIINPRGKKKDQQEKEKGFWSTLFMGDDEYADYYNKTYGGNYGYKTHYGSGSSYGQAYEPPIKRSRGWLASKKKIDEQVRSSVDFLRDGVKIGSRDLKDRSFLNDYYSQVSALINNGKLKLVLSGNDILEDDEYERTLQNTLYSALLDLNAKLASMYDSLILEEKKYAKKRLMCHFRTFAPGFNLEKALEVFEEMQEDTQESSWYFSSKEKDQPVGGNYSHYHLANAKLFETVDYKKVSLLDIKEYFERFGAVYYAESKGFMRPFKGRMVIRAEEHTKDILEKVFEAGSVKDYSTDLIKEASITKKFHERSWKNQNGKKAKGSVRSEYLESLIIHEGGITGEIGFPKLPSTHTSFVLLKDDMVLDNIDTNMYLGAIRIKGEFSSKDFKLNAAHDGIEKNNDAYRAFKKVIEDSTEELYDRLISSYKELTSKARIGIVKKKVSPLKREAYETHLANAMRHFFKRSSNQPYSPEDKAMRNLEYENSTLKCKLANVNIFRTTSGKRLSLADIIEDFKEHGDILYVPTATLQKPFNRRNVLQLTTTVQKDLLKAIFEHMNTNKEESILSDYTDRFAIESIAMQNRSQRKLKLDLAEKRYLATIEIDEDGVKGEIGIPYAKRSREAVQLCISQLPIAKSYINSINGCVVGNDMTGLSLGGVINYDRLTANERFDGIIYDVNYKKVTDTLEKHLLALFMKLAQNYNEGMKRAKKKKAKARLKHFIMSHYGNGRAKTLYDRQDPRLEDRTSPDYVLMNAKLFTTSDERSVSLIDLLDNVKLYGELAYVPKGIKGQPLDEDRLVVCLADVNDATILQRIFPKKLLNYSKQLRAEVEGRKNMQKPKSKLKMENKDKSLLARIKIDEDGVKGEIGIGTYFRPFTFCKYGVPVQRVIYSIGADRTGNSFTIGGIINSDDLHTNTKFTEVKIHADTKAKQIVDKYIPKLFAQLADNIRALPSKTKPRAKQVLAGYLSAIRFGARAITIEQQPEYPIANQGGVNNGN